MTRHSGHPLRSDEGQALAVEATDHPQQTAEMIAGALHALVRTEDRRRHPVEELRPVYLRGVAAMALVAAAANGEQQLTSWDLRPNPLSEDEVTAKLLTTAFAALTAAMWVRRELAARAVDLPWPRQEHEAAMYRVRAQLLAGRGRQRRLAPKRKAG